jgi:DNA repair exonuclease SbcCD ATPase subunit
MTPEERTELIAAVQAALVPFNEEIRTELIEPLRAEMRQGNESLRAEMHQGNEELRAEMRQGNESLRQELQAEIQQVDQGLRAEMAQLREDLPNIILDTVKPFIVLMMEEFQKAGVRSDRIEERLDRLENRLDRLEARAEGLDRKFMYLADEVAELKAQVGRIEEALTAHGVKLVKTPAERWASRQDLQRVEQRVTQLEVVVYAQPGGGS